MAPTRAFFGSIRAYQCAVMASGTIKIDPNGCYSLWRNALRRRATSVSEVVDSKRNRWFGSSYGLEECML